VLAQWGGADSCGALAMEHPFFALAVTAGLVVGLLGMINNKLRWIRNSLEQIRDELRKRN
jgi:hypothetical protein